MRPQEEPRSRASSPGRSRRYNTRARSAHPADQTGAGPSTSAITAANPSQLATTRAGDPPDSPQKSSTSDVSSLPVTLLPSTCSLQSTLQFALTTSDLLIHGPVDSISSLPTLIGESDEQVQNSDLVRDHSAKHRQENEPTLKFGQAEGEQPNHRSSQPVSSTGALTTMVSSDEGGYSRHRLGSRMFGDMEQENRPFRRPNLPSHLERSAFRLGASNIENQGSLAGSDRIFDFGRSGKVINPNVKNSVFGYEGVSALASSAKDTQASTVPTTVSQRSDSQFASGVGVA